MASTNYSSPQFLSKDDLIDERTFNFGEIWKIRDCLISIPDADRINSRNEHFCRTVVIVDNNKQNSNKFSPIITVAPLSHRLDCMREFDIPLSKEKDGVKEDCLLRMSLAQPVLKKDLYERIGEIHDDSKDEIIDVLLQKIGINPENL
ncbi:MAG: mRNA interferase MazF [Deferribacteres bacterium]|nr:mRNA interferase MazF [Deferribacteres bacterium]